jgi:5-(aminomethyl)-3-furanmethanol phosphate kinase
LPPWVVKLGGSLEAAGTLKPWVDAIAVSGVPVVICPGGGRFADGVRAAQARWGVDDRTAHRMAILAMEQSSHLLCGLRPDLVPVGHSREVGTALGGVTASVWFPAAELLDDAGIPCSWDITSDSLSAVLARRVGARGLVLVKSAPLPDGPLSIGQSGDLLDDGFALYGSRCGCPVWLLSGADSDGFERLAMQGAGGTPVRFEQR